jgi:hypothetical protein
MKTHKFACCVCAAVLSLLLPKAAVAYALFAEPCKRSLSECMQNKQLQFISNYGIIGSEDLSAVKQIDELLAKDAEFPIVYLNSIGGSAQSAMEIGRILHRRHATVVSGSPIFPAAASQCSSACVIIAAGGTTRLVTHIGIHQSFIPEEVGCNKFEQRPSPAWAEKQMDDYFLEMGIPNAFNVERRHTTIDNVEALFYDSSKTARDQKIVQYGFFQPDKLSAAFKIDDKPSVDLFHSTENFESNAVLYGSKGATWDLIQYLAAPDMGQRGLQEAFFLLKALANGGDAKATYLLGNYYLNGYGTDRDVELGNSYHAEAAELGVAEAQYLVGRDALLDGRRSDAAYWFGQSAMQKYPHAIVTLCDLFISSQLFTDQKVSGVKWCKIANQIDTDQASIRRREMAIDTITNSMSTGDRQLALDQSISMRADTATFSKCEPGTERQ